MAEDNHTLFIGVSICGLDSYDKTENSKLVPTPYERILFLEKLKQAGVINLLFLRPIFPEKIIPTSEYLEIIDLTTGYISGIVTAGLLVHTATFRGHQGRVLRPDRAILSGQF